MDRRQRKRILIFLFVPLLAAVLFVSDDLVIRIIAGVLIVIYVAIIIFFRNSTSYEKSYESDYEEETQNEDHSSFDENEIPEDQLDDSFEIISGNKNLEVITAENYNPEKGFPKNTLKPPDLKEKFEEIANEELPHNSGDGGQFSFVLERILIVLKEAYVANTAIFFWYNKRKEKLSIEKFASNSTEIDQRKYDLEDDILSKIVESGEPELLSDISSAAERDVIRYYSAAQGIRSFVGVPIFYNNILIGILALDAKVGDAFGIETIYALGRFVRVITMVITLFEEKTSDTVSQKRLQGLLKLIGVEKNFSDENELLNSLMNSLQYFIKWDALAFVYFNPVEKKFKTEKVINKTTVKYIGENLDVEINGTLVGKSIATGMPVKIDDTANNGYVRFAKIESVLFDGSFLAIPLVYQGQNYGVLCFESLLKNVYSNADVKFLKNALNIFSFVIYSYSTQKLLKSYLAIDIETNALNEETFRERLKSDLHKAELLKIPGALALIKIDDFVEQETLFEENPFPKVLKEISETIAAEMTPLNLFGRINEKVFGVYFFNSNTKNVYLWAEKLRVKIARKPVVFISKQTTYTVSIGVASAKEKTDVDEVLHNANLALDKAIEKGGNKVCNIN